MKFNEKKQKKPGEKVGPPSNLYKPSLGKYKRFIDATWMTLDFIDLDCAHIEKDFFVLIEDKVSMLRNKNSLNLQKEKMLIISYQWNAPFIGLFTSSLAPDVDKHQKLLISGNARIPLHMAEVTMFVTNYMNGKRLDIPIVVDSSNNKQYNFDFENLSACMFKWLHDNKLITPQEEQHYREVYLTRGKEWEDSDFKKEFQSQLIEEGYNTNILNKYFKKLWRK